MKKLLVICGPTATGKTKLAISLAKKFNGEVVSADSKQVYKGMNIGTGKGLPINPKPKTQNSKPGTFYEIEGVKIWGYDLVDPKKEFSVAQYTHFADKIITRIQNENKLPILVGGTGLYIKAVVDGIGTIDIPRNADLRKSLADKTAAELFETLAQVDSIKAGGMNLSDRANSRRLVRAVEIAQWRSGREDRDREEHMSKDSNSLSQPSILLVGLTALKDELNRRIEERVDSRLKKGIENEIRSLLRSGVTWDDQSMSSLGYREWKEYFKSLSTRRQIRKTAIEEWKKDEKRYAKRQMTWFKKDGRIHWFDVSSPGWQSKVERLVKKWHN
jgi:tRNA dimethylallyltransferase